MSIVLDGPRGLGHRISSLAQTRYPFSTILPHSVAPRAPLKVWSCSRQARRATLSSVGTEGTGSRRGPRRSRPKFQLKGRVLSPSRPRKWRSTSPENMSSWSSVSSVSRGSKFQWRQGGVEVPPGLPLSGSGFFTHPSSRDPSLTVSPRVSGVKEYRPFRKE